MERVKIYVNITLTWSATWKNHSNFRYQNNAEYGSTAVFIYDFHILEDTFFQADLNEWNIQFRKLLLLRIQNIVTKNTNTYLFIVARDHECCIFCHEHFQLLNLSCLFVLIRNGLWIDTKQHEWLLNWFSSDFAKLNMWKTLLIQTDQQPLKLPRTQANNKWYNYIVTQNLCVFCNWFFCLLNNYVSSRVAMQLEGEWGGS